MSNRVKSEIEDILWDVFRQTMTVEDAMDKIIGLIEEGQGAML